MKRRVVRLGFAVPLGRACLASQWRPPTLCSRIRTCCASAAFLYVTKPKPLDSPVFAFLIIVASCSKQLEAFCLSQFKVCSAYCQKQRLTSSGPY